MRWAPPGFGGERRPPEKVKEEGWREQGLLAVSVDDQRLSWPEREFIRQLGEKLYGNCASNQQQRNRRIDDDTTARKR